MSVDNFNCSILWDAFAATPKGAVYRLPCQVVRIATTFLGWYGGDSEWLNVILRWVADGPLAQRAGSRESNE